MTTSPEGALSRQRRIVTPGPDETIEELVDHSVGKALDQLGVLQYPLIWRLKLDGRF